MRISEKLQGQLPYNPGGKPCKIVLNANESFVPFSEDLQKDMQAVFDSTLFNRYPDPRAGFLCEAFGNAFAVDPGLVTAGNGSDEIIDLLFACLVTPGDKALVMEPDFSMYTKGAFMHDVTICVYEKEDAFVIDADAVLDLAEAEDPALILFSNPCNPTGRVLPREHVLKLVDRFKGLVVVDEAYMEFSDQSVLDEVARRENLIVLKTCSKAYAAAALRVGFAVAPEAITRLLQAGKAPYNVGTLVQALATCILNRPEEIDAAVQRILASRDHLVQGLKELQESCPKLRQVYPTDTNFVLLEIPEAQTIFLDLQEQSVLVRCMDDCHLRVCAGTEAENEGFLRALAHCLKEKEA